METVLKYGVKIRIKCIIKTSEIYLTFIHAPIASLQLWIQALKMQ